MQDGHENAFGANQPKRPDELATNENVARAFENNDNIETEPAPPQSTPEERVEAIEEGIRLTEISRNTALGDLEKWRSNKTTDPSHFEYRLPEIQNRISRAEHSITSSRLDIDVIKASPVSPEEESVAVQKFIAGQILENKTLGIKNKLTTIEKQESDFNERMVRSQSAAEKLQTGLAEIDTALVADGSDAVRLKQHRRDLLIDLNSLSDRYESLMKEKITIDASSSERAVLEAQVKEIVSAGLSDDELPKSIQEDPDFAACLREAETCASDDSRQFNHARKFDPQEAALKLFRNRFPKKGSYYDRLPKEQILSSNEVPENMNEQVAANQEVVTREQTVAVIKAGIEKGKINSRPDFEKLKTEPIIDTKSFYDVEPTRAEQAEFEYVDSSKIIGRPNANNYENGWAHEYINRGGRIAEIVDQINHYENVDGVEKIFHIEDNATERIKLAGYEGPSGPIYTVLDGTHRVAGVKASGLEQIPAEIHRTNYPFEKSSADAEEIADWQSKIERGFITGAIETIETKHGERSVLSVTSEVLPWIRARNQNDVFKINQIYNQQYPGAIERAGFPAETLTDKTAFWAYMDGNFDQWKTLQEETRPEDKTAPDVMIANESLEKRKPKTITTSKGSIYTFLPDGRTQRYKTAEGKMEAPQDLLVFIPPWENITQKAKELYPEIFSSIDNAIQFEQLLLEYMVKGSPKTIRPAMDGNETYSLESTPPEATVFLNFINKDTKRVDFALPTSREPKIGYSTFDARRFLDSADNIVKRERHIGNKIVSIDYE